MANVRDRAIFFPRYTTFAGDDTFTTLPVNVTAYEAGDVTVKIGTIVGPTAGGSVSAVFEESTDQETWTTCAGSASAVLGSGDEARLTPGLAKAWLRLKVVVTKGTAGDLPVVTGYATGFLERRR